MEAEWEETEDRLELISLITRSLEDRSEINKTVETSSTITQRLEFDQNLGFEYVVLRNE